MLNQSIITESSILNKFEMNIFTKIINYAINLILNEQNQLKIDEFIEIDTKEGEKITDLTLVIIKELCKYRSNFNELIQNIALIRIDKDKKQVLKQKINSNLYQLRKVLYQDQLHQQNSFHDLQWRFEVQIASKTKKNIFKPNVLLNFQIAKEQDKKIVNNLINCDYANLKNLYDNLAYALKSHQSMKHKTAQNSIV